MNSKYKTKLYKSLSSQRRNSSKSKYSRKSRKSFNLDESSHKRNKYDFLLRHDTHVLEYLYYILKDGFIKSPNELKLGSSSEEPDAIFFTPVPHNFIYNDNTTYYNISSLSFSLYLDYEKVLNHYDSYFINNSNSFKPLNGKYPKRMHTKFNRCHKWETHHHNLDPIKYPNIEHNPCHRTYNQIMKIINSLKYNEFIEDEEGPEIAFMTPRISLRHYLKYIIVPDRIIVKDIRFLKKINKTLDEIYDEMREITERFGGKFIEVSVI
jgi:hypothetical protein